MDDWTVRIWDPALRDWVLVRGGPDETSARASANAHYDRGHDTRLSHTMTTTRDRRHR